MIRTIVPRGLLTLFMFYLSACGGGGGSSNNPLVMRENSSVANAEVSSVQASQVVLPQSSSAKSLASSLGSRVSALIFPVNNKKVLSPAIQTSMPPKTIQVNEVVQLSWLAYSAEGILKDVSWSQVSGPSVKLLPSDNLLKITAGQVGDVMIEGRVTDSIGNIATVNISFTVTAPFSAKAKLLLGNSSGSGLDLVIVGDGFLAEDQDKLEAAALSAVDALLAYDNMTLQHYQSLLNVWLVESVSTTRTIPENGVPGSTLFGAYFNCANIMRLLCVNDASVLDFVVTTVPQYDQVLVLINSEIYGGAGGQLATASLNPSANNVAIHELGHSLVHLADEYTNGDGQAAPFAEPAEPNVTINKNPKDAKWNYWFENSDFIAGVNKSIFDENEVGYFEGGYYQNIGVWRPTFNSIMRSLDSPFGRVNAEAWALAFWRYYSPQSVFLPEIDTPIAHNDLPAVFSVNFPLKENDISITWWVNDVKVDGSAPYLVLSSLDDSIHRVEVVVDDATLLIRRDPFGFSQHKHAWVIQ